MANGASSASIAVDSWRIVWYTSNEAIQDEAVPASFMPRNVPDGMRKSMQLIADKRDEGVYHTVVCSAPVVSTPCRR